MQGVFRWIDVPALYVLVLEQALQNLRLSDAHVKGDSDGDLPEMKVTDKGRRRKQSPTKRRKIEHESSLLFEVLASSVVDVFHTYMQFTLFSRIQVVVVTTGPRFVQDLS